MTDGVGIAPKIPRTNTFMSRKGPKEQSLRATGKSDSEREARGSQDSPRALRCGKEQGPQPSPLWVACKRACSQVYARCEYYFRHLDVETGRRQPTARVAGTTSSSKKQPRQGRSSSAGTASSSKKQPRQGRSWPVTMEPPVQEWLHLDCEGQEFGPFATETMRAWFSQGCCPIGDELRVRRPDWKRHMPVHALYPEKGKAFVGPPRQLEAEQKPRGRSREHAHRPGWQRNSKRSVDAPEDAVERKTLQGAGTEPYRSTVPVSLTDSDTPSPGARQAESGVASSSSSTWSEYEAPHSAKKAVRRRPLPSDRQASPRRRLLGHTVQ